MRLRLNMASLLAPVVVTTLCAATMALADPPDYGRTGPYVSAGASIGTSVGYEDEIEQSFGLQSRVDSAVGAEVRAGYRILSWLAAEGQFDWIPGFDAKETNDLKIVDGTTWLASANAKAFARPSTRFQPFALVGLGYMKTENQLLGGGSFGGDGFALRVGGGLDAHINAHWAISVDVSYVLPTGAISNFDYVDIGFGTVYRF